jgi:MFS family permease
MSRDAGTRRALALLCAAQLLVFLDATVVNVALPSVQLSLHLSRPSLAWVIDAYLYSFGALLLVCGRVADAVGRRRVLGWGLISFTAASAVCATAGSEAALVGGRALQGAAAAAVSAAGLAMIVTLHDDPAERRRALGAFSAVAAGGGSLGVLAGGVLTQLGGWRAIFLVNLPLGLVLAGLTLSLLPPAHQVAPRRTKLPGRLLRSRQVVLANLLAALLRAALVAWFFFTALYLQRDLGLSPLEVGLAFLPATLLIGGLSYALTPRLVARYGAAPPVIAGAAAVAAGLGFLAVAGGGSFASSVLPGMVLVGAGGGTLFMPLTQLATTALPHQHAGMASGLLATSQQLGGAFGLWVLANAGGMAAGFAFSAGIAGVAAGAGSLLLRSAPARARPPNPPRPAA